MSKITTADCVAYIVANTLPKSYVADWKRIRKANDGFRIVRTFQNRQTGAEVIVVEKPDGTLAGEVKAQPTGQPPVPAAKKGKPKAYFAVIKHDPDEDGLELTLCVCDIGHWNAEHCASDFTPDGTFEELNRLGIPGAELQEGEVEFYQPTPDLLTLKAKLDSSSYFEFSKEFEKFMQKHDSVESSVIPWASIGTAPASPAPASPVVEATQEDCLALLKISSSEKWTFISKRPTGNDTLWTFATQNGGGGFAMMVEVSGNRAAGWAKAAEEAAKNPAPAWTPPYQPTLKDWAAIKANPVKVDLSKVHIPQPTDPEFDKYNEYDADRYKGWSGRIIFDVNEIEDDYDQISFYCGPEDDGHLDDGEDGGTYEKLRVLFSDMNPDVGAAENFHIVPIIKGVTGKEIWKVVRERLLRSGAKESKD